MLGYCRRALLYGFVAVAAIVVRGRAGPGNLFFFVAAGPKAEEVSKARGSRGEAREYSEQERVANSNTLIFMLKFYPL